MVSNPLYGTFVGDALLNNPQVPTPSWVSDADRTAYAQLYGRVWTEAMTRVPPPAPLPAPARYLINGVEQYADGTPVPGGYNAHDDAVRQLAEQGYPNPVVAPDGTVLNPGPPAGPAAVDDPTVTGASFAGVGGGALALLAIAGIAGALMRKRS
jgi:hypothetical protein